MRQHHRSALAVVAATVVLFAATACSSSSGGSSTTAAKTYTASELPPILKKAEKKLKVSGTVQDNKKVQAELKKLKTSGTLTKLLSTAGASISPAACKTEVSSGLSVAPPAKTIASVLAFGNSEATVASESGKKLPTTVSSAARTRAQKLLSQCSTMKITVSASGQSETVNVSIKKVHVTTTADRAVGIEESIQVPTSGGASKPVTLELISAVQGNLLINAETASTATTAAATTTASSTADPSLAKVVDAIVAASK